MHIRIEEVGKDYPVVCLIVENHEGEFLNRNYEWEKIPAHEACIFKGRLDRVKKEMEKISVKDFYANWAMIYEGKISLGHKTPVIGKEFSEIQ